MTNEQPRYTMEEVRAIIFQWLDLIAAENVNRNYYDDITPEVVEDLKLAADKSAYLARRFAGVPHRTEPCPVHKGRWSGITWGDRPVCGCDLTGWLPTEAE